MHKKIIVKLKKQPSTTVNVTDMTKKKRYLDENQSFFWQNWKKSSDGRFQRLASNNFSTPNSQILQTDGSFGLFSRSTVVPLMNTPASVEQEPHL